MLLIAKSKVLITDHVLMWNVKINLTQDLLSGPIPAPSDTKHFIYSYDNIENNTFILPLTIYDQPALEINATRLPNNEIEFVCSETFIKDDYKKIEITKPDLTKIPKDVESFSNSCDILRLLKKEHLRTSADVNYILTALSQKHFLAEFNL